MLWRSSVAHARAPAGVVICSSLTTPKSKQKLKAEDSPADQLQTLTWIQYTFYIFNISNPYPENAIQAQQESSKIDI
jgi:hypothetical protein